MTLSFLRKHALYAGAAIPAIALLNLGLAAPAQAQDNGAAGDQAVAPAETSGPAPAIIVTGTRIVSPNVTAPVPVTSVQGEQFFETGQISVGDILNELPSLRNSFSMQNSTVNLGTAALGLLDLRGLGTQRTLVLVNGRRHVASDIFLNSASVDVNTIPNDLIERVDIVTGGNSAVYGSDAIAGVVNFVLKDNYEGLQLRAQNGISKYNDANSGYVSALWGKNFADGRGNIAINAEYAHQADMYMSQRPNTNSLGAYLANDNSLLPDDNIPDRTFYNDVRYGYYSDGGTIFGYDPSIGLIPYLFTNQGTIVKQTGQRVDDPTFAVPLFIGGNGDNFRSGHQAGLRPRYDRYGVNLVGHFEVSPAFVPFVEAKYVQTKSLSNNAGPFFIPAYGVGDGTFSIQNPFLTAQASNFIRTMYADYYGDPSLLDPSVDFPFTMYRSVTDLGNREELAKRETYRIVAGARGDLSPNWHYEVSGNYGVFDEDTTVLGNVNFQRYMLAQDAVRDPKTGNIVCRAQIDPTARQISPAVDTSKPEDVAFANSLLAADVAACVPGNFFGVGNLSAAARNYIDQDTVAHGRITQLDFTGFISGDTTGWFELPGGPIGLVAGLEYRRETAAFDADPLVEHGITFYNALQSFHPPAQEVKEAFGEIRFPILASVPFAEELTVSGAARYSDYNNATGGVLAYNVSGRYSPVRDITFRANYSRSVRAPNLADLYTPLGQNFAPQFQDPCALHNIQNGSPTREANCRADGVPNTFDYNYTSSLIIKTGGNPNLAEETSDSITAGVILQPRWIPGLSISADYFDITVDGVITSPTAQQIVDACYDASDLQNQFCDLIQRQPAGGLGPAKEIPGRILEGTLAATLLNYASLKVRGVDVNASYRHTFPGINTTLSGTVYYTHVFQNDQFLDPTDPTRADQVLLELGDPEDAVNVDISAKHGRVTLGYQMRYVGPMVLNEFETVFSKQGRPAEDPDYAEDLFYPSRFYHDIRIQYDGRENYSVYAGVDNVTNTQPPKGLSGTGYGSGIYDVIGRYFYVGAVTRF